eukprot:CAMPEP_0194064640 /NCGR_PEP_ID=MMETSP0009_2-20130614/83580_1 /TAXON_ID=210454 /ORGANISM="Grammatophora oceanica, Strain CCMP 410" /LENGTH=41 /DNA_ID= /DNA_START= /DNA_END= /DNA_ORIENTATION=
MAINFDRAAGLLTLTGELFDDFGGTKVPWGEFSWSTSLEGE